MKVISWNVCFDYAPFVLELKAHRLRHKKKNSKKRANIMSKSKEKNRTVKKRINRKKGETGDHQDTIGLLWYFQADSSGEDIARSIPVVATPAQFMVMYGVNE